MTNICRLCVGEKSTAELVFIYDESLDLETKLARCCQVVLSKDTNLGQYACSDCIERLEASWCFAEKVAEAQLYFKQHVKSENIDKNNDTKPNTSRRKKKRVVKPKRKAPLESQEIVWKESVPLQDEQHEQGEQDEHISPPYLTNQDDQMVEETCQNPAVDASPETYFSCTNLDEATEIVEMKNEELILPEHVVECSEVMEDAVMSDQKIADELIEFSILPAPIEVDERNESSEIKILNDSPIKTEKELMSDDDNINQFFASGVSLDEQDIQSDAEDQFIECDEQQWSVLADSSRNPDGTVAEASLNQESVDTWSKYPWDCCDCGKRMSSAVELESHCSTHHKTAMRFLCVDCSKTFNKYFTFIRHVRSNHRPQLKYCCDICSTIFWDLAALRHHRSAHATTAMLSSESSLHKPFACTSCDRRFSANSALQTHARSHLPPSLKNKFACDLCPKRFGTQPNLISHKRIHSGVREYTCDQCGKSFVQKGNLDHHLLTHIQNRPFVCNVCDKSFKTQLRLNNHKTVHSGLKPHQCDICGRQFREKGTLREHHRIHTGALPFTCEFCGKKFRFKGVLTTHRRQHTGERPYSCVDCNHHFANWPNYNKHMKRRHGINTSVTVRKPCEIPPSGMPAKAKQNHIVPTEHNMGLVTLSVNNRDIFCDDELVDQENTHEILHIKDDTPTIEVTVTGTETSYTQLIPIETTPEQHNLDGDSLVTSCQGTQMMITTTPQTMQQIMSTHPNGQLSINGFCSNGSEIYAWHKYE